MHLITGGAFNGKKQWVMKTYELEAVSHQWVSFYKREKTVWTESIVVLEGIECYMKQLVEQTEDAKLARKQWKQQLQAWLDWEKEKPDRKLLLIGSDITKGIVPIEALDRMWRDAAGWCFQEAAKQAEQVTAIWYGIPQILKKQEEPK
ncbi:bifunctional adenosylcobinamide kinase/adenosylcobinamide-phosphate guanylyltransferase [Bacillus sp. FJAT-42315]|uniref:bifunctional adenosylcobinamide kinase/adenosylcobinamide-phosphate guanylyltransferase n=1 Tax=Bacillus sp. FJAT-42315 TaxID=2014077 RepID=UPI000C233ECA|nr:bifunctional adenosylcobinamide kinase/adenosylcobinamide-phosphate guanylyltransferase [Bacillus sp. FJAT-42315]